jgi:hypothetical protein
MSLIPISSYILSDPNYRFAILYSVIDKAVCNALNDEFGSVQIRFQVKVEQKKVNIKFFFLDKYYLSYLKVNEKNIIELIQKNILSHQLAPKNYYKIYMNYVAN